MDSDNLIHYTEEYDDTLLYIVNKYWSSGEYIKSVLLDLISQGECTVYSDEDVEEEVVLGQISDYICSLMESDEYCDYLHTKYGVNDVREHIESKLVGTVECDLWGYGEYKVYKSQRELSAMIKKALKELKEDKELREALK